MEQYPMRHDPWIREIEVEALPDDENGEVVLVVTFTIASDAEVDAPELVFGAGHCPLLLDAIQSSAASIGRWKGPLIVFALQDGSRWDGSIVRLEMRLGAARLPIYVPDDLPTLVGNGPGPQRPLPTIRWITDGLVTGVRFLGLPAPAAQSAMVWGAVTTVPARTLEIDGVNVGFSAMAAALPHDRSVVAQQIVAVFSALERDYGSAGVTEVMVISEAERRRENPWTGMLLSLTESGLFGAMPHDHGLFQAEVARVVASCWVGGLWRTYDIGPEWLFWGIHSGMRADFVKRTDPWLYSRLLPLMTKRLSPSPLKRFQRDVRYDMRAAAVGLHVLALLETEYDRATFRRMLKEFSGTSVAAEDVMTFLALPPELRGEVR